MSYIWWVLLGLFVFWIGGKLAADVQEFKEEEERERLRKKRIGKLYGREEK